MTHAFGVPLPCVPVSLRLFTRKHIAFTHFNRITPVHVHSRMFSTYCFHTRQPHNTRSRAQNARFQHIASMRTSRPAPIHAQNAHFRRGAPILVRRTAPTHAKTHQPIQAAPLTSPRSPVRAPARARPASRRDEWSDPAPCRGRDRNNRAFPENIPPAARPRRSARRQSAARP